MDMVTAIVELVRLCVAGWHHFLIRLGIWIHMFHSEALVDTLHYFLFG